MIEFIQETLLLLPFLFVTYLVLEAIEAKAGSALESLLERARSIGPAAGALAGDGLQTLTLPAFDFDGERKTAIACDGRSLTVTYRGWTCRYVTDGVLVETGKVYGNRNGHARRFDARGDGRLTVTVSLSPAQD